MQRITREDRPRDNEKWLRDLLVRGLAGEAHAYHAFLKELSAHLRAFLRKRLVNLPDDVEDLVQESLLAVHNQRHTYDPGQPLTAWVHAIAKYKLVDLLRRRASRDLVKRRMPPFMLDGRPALIACGTVPRAVDAAMSGCTITIAQ